MLIGMLSYKYRACLRQTVGPLTLVTFSVGNSLQSLRHVNSDTVYQFCSLEGLLVAVDLKRRYRNIRNE